MPVPVNRLVICASHLKRAAVFLIDSSLIDLIINLVDVISRFDLRVG